MTEIYNLLRPYLRGWPIILVAMLISYLAAKKYLNYVTPMYESTAKLRLADLNEGIPNSNLYKDLDVFASTQKINTEIEILKSYSLISKALEKIAFEIEIYRKGNILKTELYDDSPILIHLIEWDSNLYDTDIEIEITDDFNTRVTLPNGENYMGKIGDTIQINNSHFYTQLNEELFNRKENVKLNDQYLFTVLSKSAQVSQILSGLDIIAVEKDVPVIRISYKSSHPKKAAILPNKLAEAYIEDYIEGKNSSAQVTVDFLEERINQMAKKLSETEQAILDYREGKNITNIRQETETDLRKISQLKIQQTNLSMSLDAIILLENYVNDEEKNFLDLAPNFEAFTDLLSTEIIKNIKNLQAEKKDLLLEYTEKDERVMVIDDKINDLTSYLKESISNTRKNLETKFNNLSDEIERNQKIFVEVPEKERIMTIMNREFEIYQKSYNFLNQKKIEAEIVAAVKVAFHRVITPAQVSKKPVSPNRIIIVIVAVIFGMMGALFLIFIVHTLKARVNNISTLESSSMIPIVATVPKLKTDDQRNNFFVKTISEWEVRGILENNYIITLSGYKLSHGVSYLATQLTEVFIQQNRKILQIDIVDGPIYGKENFWHEEVVSENLTKASVNQNSLKKLTTQFWNDFLRKKSSEYNQVIIVNSCFGDPFTMPTMNASNLNLVCFDTRLTRAKLIEEVDLMKEKYSLDNTYFILNRVGYNPNVLKEFKVCFNKTKKRFFK